VRFAVIGDMGTGGRDQYETAQRMVEARQRFPFDFVIMVGDNIYGSSGPSDMQKKFEIPYKPLLDAGVKFYAALGNHDDPNERFYQYFNMNGQQYYTFKQGNVRFFVLDSNYMSPEQQAWLAKELKNSGSQWKIAYFHHPLYSSGGTHGSSLELRQLLEPLFMTYKVQVVFEGHDHVYERVKPQQGTVYFTEGSSGQLRAGDLKRASFTDSGFDTDRTFMLVEIAGDEMYFQTITRTGRTIDSGVIVRGDKTETATAAPETPAKPAAGTTVTTPPAAGTEKPATTVEEKVKPTTAPPAAPPAKSAAGTAAPTTPPTSVATKAVGDGGGKTTSTTTAKAQPASTTTAKAKAAASKVTAKAKRKPSRTMVAKSKTKKKATAVKANKARKSVVVATAG
jgi:predicted phosphodiesterase